MAKAATRSVAVHMPEFDLRALNFRLIGDSPLICHAWSERAINRMLDDQTKVPKQAREARNPRRDFLESLYPHPEGGYGFPSVAFKAAAVDACTYVDGITKVEARGVFHINAELLRVHGDDPVMRRDMVRVGFGSADMRFRSQFINWHVDVPIRYNASVLSEGQIVHLFNMAGFHVGIGEKRPQKGGDQYGRFHVAKPHEWDGEPLAAAAE